MLDFLGQNLLCLLLQLNGPELVEEEVSPSSWPLLSSASRSRTRQNRTEDYTHWCPGSSPRIRRKSKLSGWNNRMILHETTGTSQKRTLSKGMMVVCVKLMLFSHTGWDNFQSRVSEKCLQCPLCTTVVGNLDQFVWSEQLCDSLWVTHQGVFTSCSVNRSCERPFCQWDCSGQWLNSRLPVHEKAVAERKWSLKPVAILARFYGNCNCNGVTGNASIYPRITKPRRRRRLLCTSEKENARCIGATLFFIW